MSHRVIIGVMGPGEGADPETCAIAYDLGAQIAQAGWVVLTGGRNVGVMRSATLGAKQAGGLTVGILPEDTAVGTVPELDVVIPTGLGQARNVVNVLASQVVVGCGWGAGTTAELALAVKFHKPVIVIQMPPVAEDFFRQLSPQVRVAHTVTEAMAYIRDALKS
ncbi:SLOG cluster 4 domain-containing protein [Synechococcus sp. C9]|uniref:SLOG cluster 4 domain-containing protein n=1 Tax=Synechococcus sp. C9 TaxID=102119 RepID=UPI0024866AD0|nr:TIGR00725 family protein [Synechococcus sp. C9]